MKLQSWIFYAHAVIWKHTKGFLNISAKSGSSKLVLLWVLNLYLYLYFYLYLYLCLYLYLYLYSTNSHHRRRPPLHQHFNFSSFFKYILQFRQITSAIRTNTISNSSCTWQFPSTHIRFSSFLSPIFYRNSCKYPKSWIYSSESIDLEYLECLSQIMILYIDTNIKSS